MLWTEYRPVIKIGPKGALGSNEIRPIHSAKKNSLPAYLGLFCDSANPNIRLLAI